MSKPKSQPKPKVLAKKQQQEEPFWVGALKQKRARRISDRAGFKKGWW